MRIFGAFLIITMLLSFYIESQKEIDTFNILLPQINSQKSGKPIQMITAQGGCFEWISSSPQLLSVKGLTSDKSNCFKRGLIQLNHIGTYHSSIYISTTNSQTQQMSNIPVRVRPIDHIQIIAKSRMMNRNQKQDLSVFAYDKDKNMFTSLQGLKFKWQIIQKQKILTKISITNSHLILPLDQRKNIQKKGFQTDLIIVKGQNPGKSLIKVTCIEPGYQKLSHQITIYVHQRFDIFPHLPTYLLIGSKFDFKLVTPAQQQINLPKSYYKITVQNKFNVQNNLNLVAPIDQTQTLLKVQDTRTSPGYQSSVMVYSKNPDQISIQADQYLVVGQKTNVKVQLFWKKKLLKGTNNKILISSTLNYDPSTNMVFYNEKKSGIVKATYQNLSVEKKVHVILPLKAVLPSNQIILPEQQTFQLKVIGGSGLYIYKIQNDEIAVISGSGLIITKKQGITTIKVIDQKANQNIISINLIVTPLKNLTPLQNNKQLNIYEFGNIFTVGSSKDNKYYSKCSSQPISLQIGHLLQFQLKTKNSFANSLKVLKNLMQKNNLIKGSINQRSLLKMTIQQFVNKFNNYVKSKDISEEQLKQYAENLQNYGICSGLLLKSYQKYDSQIDVFYKNKPNIKNKFNLRVYEQIKNYVKGKQNENNFIMTPLASLQWQTKGGSYKWDINTKKLINETLVNTKYPIIECSNEETNFQTTLTLRNQQSINLFFPVSQTITINVQCRYPSTLKIKYQKYNLDQQVVNGLKGQIIKGQIIPYTSKKQIFYNSSTLIYEFEKTHGHINMINGNKFQYEPQKMQKYTKVTFWTELIKGKKDKFHRVSASFQYQTKDMLQIENYNRHILTMFNPKNLYIFNLNKISQNGQLSCNGSVSCFYILNNKKQIRVNTTKLGYGNLQIKDKSIYGQPSISISFQVVDADQITVSIQQTSIQVYHETVANVELFYRSQLIPSWQYDIRNLILVHQSGIRSIPRKQDSNKFIMKADKAGIYNIQAQQHYPKYLESTTRLLFTVYSKISINVDNLQQSYKNGVLHYKGQIIVAANCFRQININGGPQSISINTDLSDQVIEITKLNDNSRQFRLRGLQKGKSNLMITIISLNDNSNLSIIQLIVNVKPIQSAYIYTLDQALINAQFRVIPYLIIDGKTLLNSICDLEYQWTTSQNLQIKSIKNKAGVNATAIKQGQGYIQLKIIDNDDQVILSTKRDIKVHRSLDLQLPTIIGEENKIKVSTDLLLPPNSGYSFDQNIIINKISERQDQILMIQNNKIVSSRQKGIIPIKLLKADDRNYNNFLNVIITQIRALFITNQYSQVTVQLGKVKKVKFYIQDMYGRLFYNNIENIQFDLISSNEQIFTAYIDSSKQNIIIEPKKLGQGQLLLKLKSNNQNNNKLNSLNKLLQIPHDIVNIQIGKILQPQSPIQLIVGGYATIQYHGKNKQIWEILSGQQFIQINSQTKLLKALKIGQASIMIGGYTAIVKVLDFKFKQRFVEKIKPGFNKALMQFVLSSKQDGSIFSSISNTYNFINNNMKLQCQPTRKSWFKIKSQIKRYPQGFDKLVCLFQKNNTFDLKDQLPFKLEFNIVCNRNNKKQILQTLEYPISPTFWIPKQFKKIIISYQKPNINIPIKSLVALKTTVIGGQNQWIKHWASDFNQIQILNLQIDPRGFNQNFEFLIHLQCQTTGQSQDIIVKFVMSQKSRRQIQEQNRQKNDKINQDQTISSSRGLFDKWHWTDFLIVLMAINFIAIILYNVMCSSKNPQKYKDV